MKQFYQQVRLDETILRFTAVCAVCGRRVKADRLPLICRDKVRFNGYAAGTGGGIRQKRYDKSYAGAVQFLARFFNRCSICGSWVCDACFCPDEGHGACVRCAGKQREPPHMAGA